MTTDRWWDPRSGPDGDRRDIEVLRRDRSERAFLRLHRQHSQVLLRYTYRALGNEWDRAEDAVQEVWMRALGRLDEFRGDSTLRTWLVGIAVNVCREMARKADDRELRFPAAPRPVEHDGQPVARIDLERAISSLAPGRRAVFVLHDFEGFTHREIAEILGISAGTSKSQLSDARRQLRIALSAHR